MCWWLDERGSVGETPLHVCQVCCQVCWRLDERGSVGETPLHVCLLKATSLHADLAKRMLRIYPDLIHDFYVKDEFYGKTIITGNMCAAHTLLFVVTQGRS